MAISADGSTLFSAGEDRAVKVWDASTLAPLRTFGGLADWPQALTIGRDARRLAVGLHDGQIAVLDTVTGKQVFTTRAAPPVAPPKPELVRNATLNPPNPRAVVRGKSTRVNLSGQGVHLAKAIVLYESNVRASIITPEPPVPNQLAVDLTVASDARIGMQRIGVVTPLGVPVAQTFAVEAFAATLEKEPNDDPAHANDAPFPATIVGAIERPGDVDFFRVPAESGKPLVFTTSRRALGSPLNPSLSLMDARGNTLAAVTGDDVAADPALTFTPTATGALFLRVADVDYEGSAGHTYRIAASGDAFMEDVFPIGVVPDKLPRLPCAGRIGNCARMPNGTFRRRPSPGRSCRYRSKEPS